MFSILEGRRALLGGVIATAALTSVGGLAVLPAGARAAASFDGGPTTFSYTGSPQTYTVPAGTTELLVNATGASGGDQVFTYPDGNTVQMSAGGRGAQVQTTIPVTPGEQLAHELESDTAIGSSH